MIPHLGEETIGVATRAHDVLNLQPFCFAVPFQGLPHFGTDVLASETRARRGMFKTARRLLSARYR